MPITLLGRRARQIRRKRPRAEEALAQSVPTATLRLLTLNVAHARRQARHQALLGEPALKRNLEAIAAVFRRESADIVALQEADGPSAWSGGFDHVATLSELAAYPHTFRGEHNPFSLGKHDLSSGTALLSRLPLEAPHSRAFGENWRDTKGFVAATVRVPALGEIEVDVVSIHLDFLAERIRRRQVEQLVDRFQARERPLVVCGDFNCEWSERRRSLARLRRELRLRPIEAVAHATFPAWRPLVRLDWILVSDELEFTGYRTLPDRLSDHLGVVAEICARDAASTVDAPPLRRRLRERLQLPPRIARRVARRG